MCYLKIESLKILDGYFAFHSISLDIKYCFIKNSTKKVIEQNLEIYTIMYV